MLQFRIKNWLIVLPLISLAGCAAGPSTGPAGKLRDFLSSDSSQVRRDVSESRHPDSRGSASLHHRKGIAKNGDHPPLAPATTAGENVLRSTGNSTRDSMRQDPLPRDRLVEQVSWQQPTLSPEEAWQGNGPQQQASQGFSAPGYSGQTTDYQYQDQTSTTSGHFVEGPVIRGQQFYTPQTTATETALYLKEENERLSREIARLEGISTDLNNRLTASIEDNNRANEKIARLEQEIQNQTVRYNTLLRDNDQLRNEKSALIDQSRALIAAVEQSLDEILFSQLSNPVPATLDKQ